MKMTICKIEILVIDIEDFGVSGIISDVESSRNIVDVKKVESREVEWDDDHPLNSTVSEISKVEYKRLCPSPNV